MFFFKTALQSVLCCLAYWKMQACHYVSNYSSGNYHWSVSLIYL